MLAGLKERIADKVAGIEKIGLHPLDWVRDQRCISMIHIKGLKMTDFYLDLLATTRVDDSYRIGSKELEARLGGNSGNLAFRHALSLMIELDDFVITDYAGLQGAFLRKENARNILLSAANWIGCSEAYEAQSKYRAELLRRIDCDIVVVGIGAQAPLDSVSLDVGPETRAFMRLLGTRSRLISVRDEFTATVFRHQGVENVVVTGCPSNFINPDPHLGSTIIDRCQQWKKLDHWSQVRVAFNEVSGGHKETGKVLKVFTDHLQQWGGIYICQSGALLQSLRDHSGDIPPLYREVVVNGGSVQEPNERWARFMNSFAFYADIPAWLESLTPRHLTLGMRIHGAMLGLQSGRPSLLIAHDSRTEGLARTMGIPNVRPETFFNLYNCGPSEIYKKIENDIKDYDKIRRELFARFVDVLTVGGMKLRSEFSTLFHQISAK